MNEDWIETNRSDFLKPEPDYTPLPSDSGPYKLLAEAGRTADWDLPYESIDLPTLVITGLQDHVFLERDIVDALFNRLPRARRIDMPDAGHLIPAERPEVLAGFLVDFVSEVI
jgi:pimeloyl-ACP methyl ester carboxylesterase